MLAARSARMTPWLGYSGWAAMQSEGTTKSAAVRSPITPLREMMRTDISFALSDDDAGH